MCSGDMVDVTSQMVKELREKTGAGMLDCKKALVESSGNVEHAIDYLRKKGLKDIGKRADRTAGEGVIASYIHTGSRIGVMLEMNCETDFVARGEEFQALARKIAMHVAWAKPRCVDREDVSDEVLTREQEVYRSQLTPNQIAQENVANKIIAENLQKFYEENCLLEQVDALDTSAKRRIGDLLIDLSAKVGEKILVRRFVRYEVGGE